MYLYLHTNTQTPAHERVYIYIYSFHNIPVSVGQEEGTAISAACKDILLSAIDLTVPDLEIFLIASPLSVALHYNAQ